MAEFIAENWNALLWFLAAVALLVVELTTVQLVSIWFCLGAVAATVAAVWGASGTAQLGTFFAVSALALALTRPMVQRTIHFKKVPTNADSFIGMSGSVLEDIDNLAQTGRVRAGGLDWTARSCDGRPIHVGATVVVEAIEGVKLMVRPKEPETAVSSQTNRSV